MALTPAMIEALPRTTGVYLMRDTHGHIIYIGKAIDVRARVRAYLGQDQRPSVSHIRAHTAQVECVPTANEKEALLLENQLIKAHRPRYNIVLKDDKTYVSIKVTTQQEWPGIYITRRVLKDGARYFGPYSSARATRNTLSAIGRIFPVRRCKDTEFANRVRPCLFYQIGLCLAPCVKKVIGEDYGQIVHDLVLFLEGRNKALALELEQRMRALSAAMEFERAAKIRDQIAAIQTTLVPQTVVRQGSTDIDVFGIFRHLEHIQVAVLRLAQGTMADSTVFSLGAIDEPDFITPCMLQFYLGRKDVPPVIYTDTLPQDQATLEILLSDMRGAPVHIRTAGRGRARQWVGMAQATALNNARGETSVLDEIARVLKLPAIPYRMECYDISTLQGGQSVGSRAAFLGGEPEKSLYRHYKIRTIEGQDDYAMLSEVMRRRFRDEAEAPPDLLVIDGGKGQLNMCLKALKEFNITTVPVVGMAKERGSLKDRFFLPGRKDAVSFPRGSTALRTLQHLRDEAHRFAVTYHRRLRSAGQQSALADVPGIGPKKMRLILTHIPDLSRLSAEALARIPGLTPRDVDNVMTFFRAVNAPCRPSDD